LAAASITLAAVTILLVVTEIIVNRLPLKDFLPRQLAPVMPVEPLFRIGVIEPVEPVLRLLLVVSLLRPMRVQNPWTGASGLGSWNKPHTPKNRSGWRNRSGIFRKRAFVANLIQEVPSATRST
jgi:hypothetical protein